VFHGYRGLRWQAQLLEHLFRQAQFTRCGDRLVVDDVEHGDDGHAVVFPVDLDLVQGLEAFTVVDGAAAVHESDVFLVGIDGNGP